ncbi:MAG TPA: VWA domain-containing protein [Terriglobales bacterium]|nr:VWA domain-containing protein [Terriglobales bacterium]
MGGQTAMRWVLAAVVLAGGALLAQDQPQPQNPSAQSQQPQQQPIPDAPSATKPAPTPFPPGATAPPAATQAPPPATVTTVPPGGATPLPGSGQEQLYSFIKTVNYVVVPVTVRDSDGRLVEGLTKEDFAVFEDGNQQPIKFFTSDPFPLSVAIVLDLNLSDTVMRKVNETLPALVGAFSPYDEVSIYTYGSSVTQAQDFTSASQQIEAGLKRSRRSGRTGGVPVISGPMASGPTVNGMPVDPGRPPVQSYSREAYVLNDAILEAAQDLARRDKGRRKIIFVISDGAEQGSHASYSEVLKVLLSDEVSVYAIGVDAAAIPAYDTLGKIHVPRMGYGNILPRYASATGGQVFAEFTRDSIEAAYARVTEVARNQYTLGYTSSASVANTYRSIEVRVHRPDLLVYAKGGYYPLPARAR